MCVHGCVIQQPFEKRVMVLTFLTSTPPTARFKAHNNNKNKFSRRQARRFWGFQIPQSPLGVCISNQREHVVLARKAWGCFSKPVLCPSEHQPSNIAISCLIEPRPSFQSEACRSTSGGYACRYWRPCRPCPTSPAPSCSCHVFSPSRPLLLPCLSSAKLRSKGLRHALKIFASTCEDAATMSSER